MDHHLAWHGLAQSQFIGGSHTVNQHAGLITPGDGVDYGEIIGRRGLLGKRVQPRPVIKAPIDPPKTASSDQALQSLIYGVPACQIRKIRLGPDAYRGAP
jgi:hypothetical protein